MTTDIETIKDKISPVLKRHNVEFAGIFGSYAKGRETSESDLDILVRFACSKSLLEIIALENELSAVLNAKADVVTEQSLHEYIAPYVLQELKVVYGAAG